MKHEKNGLFNTPLGLLSRVTFLGVGKDEIKGHKMRLCGAVSRF